MEKQNKRNKVGVISLVALLAIGLIAGTIAYFSVNTEFVNKFQVKNPEAQFVEEFEAPDPGELISGSEFRKSGKVINTGESLVVARAQIKAEWEGGIPNELNPDPGNTGNPLDKFASTLNFGTTVQNGTLTGFPFNFTATGTVTAPWIYVPAEKAGDFGYFYCRDTVAAKKGDNNGESGPLLDNVYISEALGKTDKTEPLYFAKGAYTNYDDAKKDFEANTGAVFASQEDFKADAKNKDEVMEAIQSATLTYKEFKDAKLNVTISSLIVQADDRSVGAAYGNTFKTGGKTQPIYDSWVVSGLEEKEK